MTEHQQGYADNYAGVPRTLSLSSGWLAGWDEAQQHRLKDEREIRKATHELQSQHLALSPEQMGHSRYGE
ncbi:hypothetical protein IAD21_00708 [Abditibacteriota bacterium]|nr:hypothetical protein IAD21_00708 [Abditibacteriota bacterium]